MSELSPQAQALIEAGRADAPSVAAKAAVKAAVLAEVGAPVPATGAEAGAAAGGGAAKLGLAGVLTLGLVAGAVYVAQPAPEPVETPTPTAAVEAEPQPLAVAPTADVADVPEPVVEATQAEPAEPKAAPAPRKRRAPVRRAAPAPAPEAPAEDEATRLAAEAKLLARMRVKLRQGAHADVLALVKTHAQRFPEGVLVEERLAAEALAHCGLADADAARAARARLVARAPRSIHLARIDEACR